MPQFARCQPVQFSRVGGPLQTRTPPCRRVSGHRVSQADTTRARGSRAVPRGRANRVSVGKAPLTREKIHPTIPRDGVSSHGITAHVSSLVAIMAPADHLPLTAPVFQILLSLVDDDLHGYALIQDIRERTDGEVSLTASTLYAAVKRLLTAGLIAEVRAPRNEKDDPRRRYYRITAPGRETLRAEAARLERLTTMARKKKLLPAMRTVQAKER